MQAGVPPDFTDAAKFPGYVHNHAALFIAGGLVIGLALLIELVFVFGIRDLIRNAGAAWASIGNLS